MPTSKLVMLGIVALGAVGVTLDGYVKVPWRNAAATGDPGQFSRLGYLSQKDLPNAIAILAPPPVPGSPAMKRDEQTRAEALPLKGSPRYELAAIDAVRTQQNTVDAFQCAFGTAITGRATPKLIELLSRVRLDVRAASYPAKAHFHRQRPFVANNVHSCYRDDEGMVQEDGSYPSARGAVGWAYALVLAKLNPKRAEEILQRGREFAQSRVVCDQEWQSDIDAGRTIAVVTVGRLEANAAFRSDVSSARKEVAAAFDAAVRPARDCRPEAIALASR
ncbi:MAG: acid phosphatase [Sphingomicrobium sp.]